MNAINPPPANHMHHRKSDPPALRIERGRLEALVDFAALGVLTYLLASGALTGDIERGAALGGILAIGGVASGLKMRGAGGSAALAICVSLATFRGLGLMVLLGSLLAMTGCATLDEARAHIVDARGALNGVGEGLQATGKGVAAATSAAVTLCAMPALAPTQECRDVIDGLGEAASALNACIPLYESAQDAIEVAGAL